MALEDLPEKNVFMRKREDEPESKTLKKDAVSRRKWQICAMTPHFILLKLRPLRKAVWAKRKISDFFSGGSEPEEGVVSSSNDPREKYLTVTIIRGLSDQDHRTFEHIFLAT